MLSSERDIKLMTMASIFNGKTFGKVLEQTLWFDKKMDFNSQWIGLEN